MASLISENFHHHIQTIIQYLPVILRTLQNGPSMPLWPDDYPILMPLSALDSEDLFHQRPHLIHVCT